MPTNHRGRTVRATVIDLVSSARWRPRLVAAGFALGTFALHVAAGERLGATGVLHQWDVLFNADPTVYMTSFTSGQNTHAWGGRSFVHPNVSNVLYPVVRGAAAVVHAVHPATSDDIARRRVAYLVCPVASAATAALLFLIMADLGVGLPGASVLTALFVASFSGLLFGSIPESYCLTGLALALLFRVATRTARMVAATVGTSGAAVDPAAPGASTTGTRAGTGTTSWIAWVAVGTIMASITITNLASFALVAASVRRLRAPWRAALTWSAGVSAAALAVTAALYAVGAVVSPHTPPFTPWVSGQMTERHGFDPRYAFLEFPASLANTILAPVPVKAPADTALHQAIPFNLSYHALPQDIPGQWWRLALWVAALAVAAVRARSAPRWQRAVMAAAWLVLAFNWALHGFYGSEMFLYSQHWEIPMLIILAGLLWAPGRPSRRVLYGALAVVTLCAWNTVYVWTALVRMLDGH